MRNALTETAEAAARWLDDAEGETFDWEDWGEASEAEKAAFEARADRAASAARLNEPCSASSLRYCSWRRVGSMELI